MIGSAAAAEPGLQLASALSAVVDATCEESPRPESVQRLGAAREVGYLSPAQFSREYARLFGRAPMRDVAELRAKGVTMDEVAS